MREATTLSITFRQRCRAITVSGNSVGVSGVRARSIARTIAIFALEVAGCLGKTKRGTVIGVLAVLLVVVAMNEVFQDRLDLQLADQKRGRLTNGVGLDEVRKDRQA